VDNPHVYSGREVKLATQFEPLPILRSQAMYVQRNIEVLQCSHCFSGKTISIKQLVCLCVALFIQHAMNMRLIVACGLSCCAMFSHLSHKRHGLEKEALNIKCVSNFFTTLSEIFFTLRKIEQDMMEMFIGLHVKYCLFLSDFNAT